MISGKDVRIENGYIIINGEKYPIVQDVSEIEAEIEKRLEIENNAGFHNSIYRGKSLGSEVTAAQWAAINAGTFDDLYIGDYWVINNVTYRIAAFDYYLNCGDTVTTVHHVVVVPDNSLYNVQMNTANVTTGGYIGSAMYTSNLETAKNTIKTAFGSSHILSHRIYLTNAVSNGRASAGAWVDSEVDLMCEQMVYGNAIFSPVSDGSNVPANYRVEKSQLPLFALEPSHITNRENWWLRDVITAAYFALVTFAGIAGYNAASDPRGVRPAFGIIGESNREIEEETKREIEETKREIEEIKTAKSKKK